MSKLADFISSYDKLVVIQAENPDGDSLGSSLGLEAIIGEAGKNAELYCPVQIPRYLRYLNGWDRVSDEFPADAEAAIIVDTSSATLLSKVLDEPPAKHFLESHPVFVIDHHAVIGGELTFKHELLINDKAVSTTEIITAQILDSKLKLPLDATKPLAAGLLSDSLGLTTPGTTAASVRTLAELVDHGADLAELESARREFMKKSAEILAYKARLIERIDYHLDGRLATVHIPWEDIEAYSDQYNPSVLVIGEMLLVEGVEIAVAIKTYPDNKLTGKIQANRPIANSVAGYFGGGGHPYAAGFRIYETYDKALPEVIEAVKKALEEKPA